MAIRLVPVILAIDGATTVAVLSVSKSKISRVPTHDATVVTFEADGAFTEYQVRRVPSPASDQTQGTLIESGALLGTDGTDYQITVTDDELIDVGAGAEGANVVKLFVKTPSGAWVTGSSSLVLPFNLPGTLGS